MAFLIAASVAVLVCNPGHPSPDACHIEDRQVWVTPTTDELGTCYVKAQELIDQGESARCEIVRIDEMSPLGKKSAKAQTKAKAVPQASTYVPTMTKLVL